MCELVWTAQSLGDDTHAVGHTAKVGHESTDFTVLCGPLCRWMVRLAHRSVLEQGARAEVNVRPGTHLKKTDVTQAIANLRAETTHKHGKKHMQA